MTSDPPATQEMEPLPSKPWTRRLGPLWALAILSAPLAWLFREIWSYGARLAVPLPRHTEGFGMMREFIKNDQLFTVGVVARNAAALLRSPIDFFEAAHCFPAENSLAFGEPMITLSLLAAPAHLLTGDPLLSYNAALFLQYLIAGMAMYLLVSDWTGSAAGGIIASLFYVFYWPSLGDPVHSYTYDTTGVVLALFFSRRLFAFGHWRDAAGLAAGIALQIGASFYPLIAAALLGLPFAVWLLIRYRLRRVRATQLALVVAVAASAALFTFEPYLELAAAGTLPYRTFQLFAKPGSYLPSGMLWPGWPCLALALAALLGRGRQVLGIEADPRPALLIGAFAVAILAAGPDSGWLLAGAGKQVYLFALQMIPGLAVVRVPGRISVGVQLVLCVLAGLGAARLLRLPPRRFAPPLAVALILLVFCVTVQPPLLGMEPPTSYAPRKMRPPAKLLAFYASLESPGDAGPMLELPFHPKLLGDNEVNPYGGPHRLWYFSEQAQQVLLAAYHGRRTSGCVASVIPPEREALHELEDRVWRRPVLRELARLGFTTIVVHHRSQHTAQLAGLQREARRVNPWVRRVGGDKYRTAFALTIPARRDKGS